MEGAHRNFIRLAFELRRKPLAQLLRRAHRKGYGGNFARLYAPFDQPYNAFDERVRLARSRPGDYRRHARSAVGGGFLPGVQPARL